LVFLNGEVGGSVGNTGEVSMGTVIEIRES